MSFSIYNEGGAIGGNMTIKNIRLEKKIENFNIHQLNNYYPFGLRMNAGVYKKYRYGYQGEFAEYDEETEFNHFELRDYDPVIGRTMVVDPYRQFASPYMWVGNNPVMGIDPTGGMGWPWSKGPTPDSDPEIPLASDVYQPSPDASTLSTKLNFKLTLGAQAGFDFNINKVGLGAEFNIASATLFGAEYEQQGNDSGPQSLSLVFPRFNGKFNVEQGVGVNGLGLGLSAEREFIGRTSGGYSNLKDKYTGGLLIGNVAREVDRSHGTVHNRQSIDIGFKAKFIIGIEIGGSFGTTTDFLSN